MSKQTILVAIVSALIGCTAQQLASTVISPASAQQKAELVRWEYQCIEAYTLEQIQKQLNAAGAQNWELVAATLPNNGSGAGSSWCLKRPQL